MNDTDQPSIAEQHPEVVDDIAESFASTFGGDVDVDDLSDDVSMQLIKDASERCGLAGIECEQRVDVIMAGARQFMIENVEESLQDMRWQLEMMFSI